MIENGKLISKIDCWNKLGKVEVSFVVNESYLEDKRVCEGWSGEWCSWLHKIIEEYVLKNLKRD